MPADLFLRPLFDWRAAVASPYGPASPTTRHVLLTLSLHMSPRGDSCFPSIELLTEETGLSRRAVVEHLRLASEEGWLAKQERAEKNGQGWRRMEYFAMTPTGAEESYKAWAGKRSAPRAPPLKRAPEKGGAPDAEGGARDDTKVVHHVHPSTSRSTSKRGSAVPAEASPVAALFKQYQQAIKDAYNGEYPPSATANGIISKLVKLVGREPAARLIDYYLATKKPYYVTRKHALEILAKDATELWLELQAKSGTPEGAAPPKQARTYLVLEGGKEARLDDYPAADHLTIAKKVAHDYGRMIHAKQARSVAVLLGAERRIYDIDELRA